MKSLVRSNGNSFPTIPTLFSDFFTKDWSDSTLDTGRSWGSTLPSVNVKDTKDNVLIEVAAPGMKRDNFKVEIDNNVLTVSSHVEDTKEEKGDHQNYTRREFSYQSFQRSFKLPENHVKTDEVSAKYVDGILHITIPKTDEAKTRSARQIAIS
jgi:HSP20 family protein